MSYILFCFCQLATFIQHTYLRSIYKVAISVVQFLLLLGSSSSTVCLSFFLLRQHLCFHFGAINHKADMNILRVFLYTHIFIFLGVVNTQGWECWLINVFLLKKIPNTSPKCLYNFTFPPAVYQSSSCSTSLTAFCLLVFLKFSHCSGYEMIPNYGFNLYSLVTNDFEPLIMCLLTITTIQAHVFLVGLFSFFIVAFLGVLFVFGI